MRPCQVCLGAATGLPGGCGQPCHPPRPSAGSRCIWHPAYLILSFCLAFLLRHWSRTDKALCSTLLLNCPSNESNSGMRWGLNPSIRQIGLAQPLWNKSRVFPQATPASCGAEDAWHTGITYSSSFGRYSPSVWSGTRSTQSTYIQPEYFLYFGRNVWKMLQH